MRGTASRVGWVRGMRSRLAGSGVRGSGHVFVPLRRQFGCDPGDVAGDLGDLVTAPGRLHVAGDRLGGEHRGAKEIDLGLGARPFPAVDGFERGRDQQPARGNALLPGGVLDPFPVVFVDADMLVHRVCHADMPCPVSSIVDDDGHYRPPAMRARRESASRLRVPVMTVRMAVVRRSAGAIVASRRCTHSCPRRNCDAGQAAAGVCLGQMVR